MLQENAKMNSELRDQSALTNTSKEEKKKQHCKVVDPISNSEESALEGERRRSDTEEGLLGAQSSPQIV